MCIKDTVKDIISSPMEFVEVTLGSRMMALAEKDPFVRKYLMMRQTFNLAIVSIFVKLLKVKVKPNLSSQKPADLLKLVKLIGPELVRFENLSPALLNASRVAEMKSIVAIAYAIVKDAELGDSYRVAAERFVNKFYPVMLQLKAHIELDDEYFQETIMGTDEPLAEAANTKT